MTLDYYRIFYYVARYKSFSNAAEMLGSNQPNITRCMNILQTADPFPQRDSADNRGRAPVPSRCHCN